MAVLGLAPHWGFVVVFMRGLRRAGLPPFVRGGAARVLPRPRHVPTTSATCERSTILVHYFKTRRVARRFARAPPRDKATPRIPQGTRVSLLGITRACKTAHSSVDPTKSSHRTWKCRCWSWAFLPWTSDLSGTCFLVLGLRVLDL